MKRILLVAVLFVFGAYVAAYVSFRQSHTEVWHQDGIAYVIFPEDDMWLYYVMRPCTYVDGALTGMRFHIGPHQDFGLP